jgi:hypothetical protein
MPLSKTEIEYSSRESADLKVRKKAKFKKKVCFILATLVAVFVSFALLLLYRPARFNPPEIIYDNQISPYLTHELLPYIYNNAQLGEPFDLVVIQKGINDIVARAKWPKELDGITISAMEVLFVPDSIVLMGTVVLGGVEFVITVMAKAALDQEQLLNLRVAKVKIGAVNVTPVAKGIAKRIYQRRFATANVDAEDGWAQISASLLNNEPFEPVFKIEDKKVRVERITITQGKVTIQLVPAND